MADTSELETQVRAASEVVRLGVNRANPAAIGLYEACGFRRCGVLPRALRVDGVYYDELMMVRTLPGA